MIPHRADDPGLGSRSLKPRAGHDRRADGKPTQLLPGEAGYVDYFGRPWAQNWEEHFEKDWIK
jgi:hypothetical protein